VTHSVYWQILDEELGTKERAEKFDEIWRGVDLPCFGVDWRSERHRSLCLTFGKQKVDEILDRFIRLLEKHDEQTPPNTP